MVCTCSSFSLSRSVPKKSAHSTECTWSVGPMGCTGGTDRTFACKSQECLWQDWYIFFYILHLHIFGLIQIVKTCMNSILAALF